MRQFTGVLRRSGVGLLALAMLSVLVVVAPSSPVGASHAIAVGGSCSLADAITAANTDAVAGGCVAGSGADVITLSGNVFLTADLPQITTDITINGGGWSIDGGGAHHPFRITEPRVTVRFNNLRIANGHTTTVPGGAIMIRTPAATIPVGITVALNQVIVESNYTVGNGGGLFCGRSGLPFVNTPQNERISVTVDNSVFRNNRARSGAGAVSVHWSCTVTVNRSAFYGNSSTRESFVGGAFRVSGRDHNGVRHDGTLNITNSTIVGNTAGAGAAIAVRSGATTRLKHVTVTGNNSTRTGNGDAAVVGTSGNTATATELRLHVENSIIYGNTGQAGDCDTGRTLKTNVGNLIGTGNCGAGVNPVSGDPGLVSHLSQTYGSPSVFPPPFYALTAFSGAVDTVDCLAGVTSDQRGASRPGGNGRCDVGAYEYAFVEDELLNASLTADVETASGTTFSGCSNTRSGLQACSTLLTDSTFRYKAQTYTVSQLYAKTGSGTDSVVLSAVSQNWRTNACAVPFVGGACRDEMLLKSHSAMGLAFNNTMLPFANATATISGTTTTFTWTGDAVVQSVTGASLAFTHLQIVPARIVTRYPGRVVTPQPQGLSGILCKWRGLSIRGFGLRVGKDHVYD